MKEDRDEHATSSVEGGESASAGKAFNPSDLTDECTRAEPSRPAKAVPIGRPISDAEYDLRKERAKNESLPSGKHAQEDRSQRERDG